MANLILFVESFFSVTQFSGHTIAADEEAAGFEATKVGRASRLPVNRWEPTTANAEHNIKVSLDELRLADMICIDRETNLRGKQVILEASNDDFATAATEIFDATLPTTPGGEVDDLTGCITEELAWLKRFTGDAHKYWRLRIPAMGAGLVPQIGHLMLGKSWQLAGPLDPPFAEDTHEVRFVEQEIETLWIGAGPARSRKTLDLTLRFEDVAEYEQARYHLMGHFRRRRPMWAILDPAEAERAALWVIRRGSLGFNLPNDWPYRVGTLSAVEHEPLVGGY